MRNPKIDFKNMTVKQWKQIITICVITLITILLFLAIFNGVRYAHYKKLIKNEQLVNTESYDNLDSQEISRLIKFLGSADPNESLSYQKSYPDLYVENDFNFVKSKDNVVYLTFDDGPNVNVTPRVLDVLKQYDVKATFFVIYKEGEAEEALYKRIVDEGHTIAVHTSSHSYNAIYSSVDAYLADFEKISSKIESVTGVKPEIFRFPGGSINSYNVGLYQELIAEMLRRGYVYYDWHVSSGDASGPSVSADKIKNNVLNTTNDKEAIVLMHDGPGHGATADALPGIIEGLKSKGYRFAALDNSVTPSCFGY